MINLRDGSVSFHLWNRSETEVPFWIDQGHGLLGDVDPARVPDATRLDEVLDWITPQLHEVFASYESKWDGRSLRGFVDEGALLALKAAMDNALETIDLRLVNHRAGLWDMTRWFDPACDCDRYGLSETSTDEELAAIGERIEVEAARDYVVLTGVAEYLVSLRSDLQEWASEAESEGSGSTNLEKNDDSCRNFS